MKLICTRDELLEGILIAQKAVPTRTTLPILQGILLDCRDESLNLRATDLEIGIECSVNAEIVDRGWLVLDSRLLGEIVRKLPPEDVEISVAEGNITEIKCANSFFRLQGQSGEEFPQLPQVDGERSLTMPQDLLKSVIRQVVFACAVEETRPILTGALVECRSEDMVMAALDGFRLAVRNVKLEGVREDICAVVPAKALNEIQRILKDTQEEVHIKLAGNHILFGMERTRVISRLLEGDFINYKQIIPEEYGTRIRLKNEELLESCERASLLAREGSNNLIKLNITKNQLEITSNAEIGDVREEILSETEGQDLEIAFNSKYLTDVLKVIEDEYLRIEFTTSISPCIIKPEGSEDYTYLLLPVRVIS
ncbi:MAG: DNA polymerase III subunit beta [Bacillota bacterium]|nr:DNA polymerase III subunit beta [Bacillota bacterium]MDD3299089.1 DNA polymerase III subunit beta [Bacillota bacterium]MDD3850065.1 DNA polymerase III subunit beta [Bacillota bacterium]MDD4706698.1 DNA polymerase III subunit beta [Bacillota bacterium]